MTTYAYAHPEEKGLGRHHADAEGREPFDPEAARARGLGPDEVEIMTQHHALMRDLDLPHGIQVVHVGRDEEKDVELVEWTDLHGTARTTGITREDFGAFFSAVDDSADSTGTEA